MPLGFRPQPGPGAPVPAALTRSETSRGKTSSGSSGCPQYLSPPAYLLRPARNSPNSSVRTPGLPPDFFETHFAGRPSGDVNRHGTAPFISGRRSVTLHRAFGPFLSKIAENRQNSRRFLRGPPAGLRAVSRRFTGPPGFPCFQAGRLNRSGRFYSRKIKKLPITL